MQYVINVKKFNDQITNMHNSKPHENTSNIPVLCGKSSPLRSFKGLGDKFTHVCLVKFPRQSSPRQAGPQGPLPSLILSFFHRRKWKKKTDRKLNACVFRLAGAWISTVRVAGGSSNR